MKDQADYSKYRCPYSHIKKECGHELHGPEDYEKTYSVWCPCGFRGPVFCLNPEELGLELVEAVEQPLTQVKSSADATVKQICKLHKEGEMCRLVGKGVCGTTMRYDRCGKEACVSKLLLT